jgi:hypothetical protein
MADITLHLTDLNERIQLAEVMLEDRRMLLAELDAAGRDTSILREMLHYTGQALAELKAHQGRLSKLGDAEGSD